MLHRAALGQARRYPAAGDPEDLAQEALLQAWKHRATCRRPDRPGPWLAAIVRQEAMRRRAGVRDTAVDDVGDRVDERVRRTDEQVAERVDLLRALAPLSDDDRRLLWLRYGDDQTQPATAHLLGVPEGTVKVRLHRLRKRLRRELGEP